MNQKPIRKREKFIGQNVQAVLRGAVSVVILLLSLALLRNQDDYASAGMFPAALMLAWTVCEALNVIELWRGPKLKRLLHLIRAAVRLLAAVLLLAGGTQPGVLRAAGLLFALTLALGESVLLLLLSPLMLLFSYTRTHRNKRPDTLIPLAGIALIVLVYIEGGYQLLRMAPDLLASVDLGGLDGLVESGLGEMGDLSGPLGP